MSQYYYQQQRNEDIASLQAMFGPPWTDDLLGVVLDYFNGNVDHAITKLLVLNEHCIGRSPQPLVEDLILSGTHKQAACTTAVGKPSTLFATPTAKYTWRPPTNTTTKIPKSMLKKPPPPRRSQVAVTMADTFQPAIINIEKQTRRRIGQPVKLPDDFLRIPKVPLFREDHLDFLANMPPPSPFRNSRKSTQNASSSSSPAASHEVPSSSPLPLSSKSIQALRASINFPTFRKTDTQNNKINNDNGKSKGMTSQQAPKKAPTAMPRARNQGDSVSMLGKFPMPNVSGPTLNFPKIQLPTAPRRRDSKNTSNNNANTAENVKALLPSPPGPPLEMFVQANHDGDWWPSPPTTASPSSSLPKATITTTTTTTKKSSITIPSWTPMKNENRTTASTPTSLTQGPTLDTTDKVANNIWSIPNMNMNMTLNMNLNMNIPSRTKKLPPSQESALSTTTPEKPGKLFFLSSTSLNSSSTSAMTTVFGDRNSSPPPPTGAVQEQDGPRPETTTTRWSFPSITTALITPTKQSTEQQQMMTANAMVSEDINNNTNCERDNTYGSIPQIEYRGITVRQLLNLVEDIRHQCVMEQWKSTDSGKGLRPRQVTMYDLVKHYVLPKTQANMCSYVEEAYGKHHYENGLPRPPQWFVSHTWNDSIFDLVQCIQQHASDRGLNADTAAYWICAFAINQHTVVTHNTFIGDTDTMDMSSVQNPLMTQKVMEVTEGMLCVIDQKNIYYSRIWCIWELYLTLERAKNTHCQDTPYGGRYKVDVYTTTNDGGKSVGLTDGTPEVDKFRPSKQETHNDENSPTGPSTEESSRIRGQPCNQVEWSELRALRQSQFRFQTCLVALDVHLETADASLEEDARRIMNCIVQHNDNSKHHSFASTFEALTVHPSYTQANALIQGTFAGMVYRRALEDCVAEKGGEEEQETMRKVQHALVSSPIENLEISFAGCTAFQIREALKFVESLPTSLRRLDLDYGFLEFQYAEEFAIGYGRLGENLQFFKLNCAYCSKLENLDRLWEELGKLTKLRHLILVIYPNKNLTSVDGLATALNNMPKLETLELEFDCFGEYSKTLGATLNSISSTYRSMLGKSSDPSGRTSELSQQFDRVSKSANLDIGGAYISDSSIQRLCRSLTSRVHDTKITTLKLRFRGGLGKKLKDVETMDDLNQALQRIRNGLKLFS